MDIAAGRGQIVLAEATSVLSPEQQSLELSFESSADIPDVEVRLRAAEQATVLIKAVEIDWDADAAAPSPDRPVGHESRKTFAEKIRSGFIDEYLSGSSILELGYVGYFGGAVPIVPQAIGVDIGYPGYDGRVLPFSDGSFDAIYSSHCFEHIADYIQALKDWYRLLKIGGFLIIVVPHQHLFEKRRRPPSRGNVDHKRFYTAESLLREVGEALDENRWRIRHLRENDEYFNYQDPPNAPSHGLYEIELVLEKIKGPTWALDDQSVRVYSPSEFDSELYRPDPLLLEMESSSAPGDLIRGPWIGLPRAKFVAEYYFRAVGWDPMDLSAEITCLVLANGHCIGQSILTSEMLREGRIAVPFENNEASSSVEFRVNLSGQPLPGALRFRGVNVRYATESFI